jgi:hypothetical protein
MPLKILTQNSVGSAKKGGCPTLEKPAKDITFLLTLILKFPHRRCQALSKCKSFLGIFPNVGRIAVARPRGERCRTEPKASARDTTI